MSHSAMEISRSIHLEQPGAEEDAMVVAMDYVSPAEPTLLEEIHFGIQRNFYFISRGKPGYAHLRRQRRLSRDNGRTWDVLDTRPLHETIEGARRRGFGCPTFITHPRTGAVSAIYRVYELIDGTLPWDKASPVATHTKLWQQQSRDHGLTWSLPAQVIMADGRYDEVHWGPGLEYGRRGLALEGVKPIWMDNDRFIIPAYMKNDEGRFCSGGLIGRWPDSAKDVEWELGALATVGPEGSSTGCPEPSIARLSDGRLFMTLRVRVGADDKTVRVPSGKFWTISDDEGATWAAPRPFHYDDGAQAYFPASLGRVFKSAGNGRLYLIANYLDQPTHGCDPRTTLQIAEIDRRTFQIRRETLTTIETRDESRGDASYIRFSNWQELEDRETGHLVLYMTPCPGDVGRYDGCGAPPHSYRYDIRLPD